VKMVVVFFMYSINVERKEKKVRFIDAFILIKRRQMRNIKFMY